MNNISEKHEFTERYKGLLAHYRMAGERINPREAHENGDIEQRHYRLKQAVKQTLILRGSFDFESRPDYEAFLRDMFVLLNKGRLKRFQEEAKVLCSLPRRRLDACRIEKGVRVSKFSTIRILRNTYSVHSRLRAECVDVHLYPEYLVVYYGQRKIIQLDRLYGSNKHSIHYSHIIESLVRKPGAFANYQYKSDLYPTSRFRIAYDKLGEQHGPTRDKCYVKLLHLAANESEAGVDRALSHLIDTEQPIDLDAIKALLNRFEQPVVCPDTAVRPVSLSDYDQLLTSTQEAA